MSKDSELTKYFLVLSLFPYVVLEQNQIEA